MIIKLTKDAFLEALIREPAEIAHRLALIDWSMENGLEDLSFLDDRELVGTLAGSLALPYFSFLVIMTSSEILPCLYWLSNEGLWNLGYVPTNFQIFSCSCSTYITLLKFIEERWICTRCGKSRLIK